MHDQWTPTNLLAAGTDGERIADKNMGFGDCDVKGSLNRLVVDGMVCRAVSEVEDPKLVARCRGALGVVRSDDGGCGGLRGDGALCCVIVLDRRSRSAMAESRRALQYMELRGAYYRIDGMGSTLDAVVEAKISGALESRCPYLSTESSFG
jgi:hypothetical protein